MKPREKPAARWGGRGAFIVGFLGLALLGGLLGVWGTQVRIAGAVIAPGAITVENNRQVVQHAEGGTVEAIHVRNGDTVTAGQPLVTLDATDVETRLRILERRIIELTVRVARLRAERDGDAGIAVDLTGLEHVPAAELIAGQERLLAARRDSQTNKRDRMRQQILQTETQIEGVTAQIDALDERIGLLDGRIATSETLYEQELIVRDVLLDRRAERARMAGERGELVALRGAHSAAIAELEIALIDLETTRRETVIAELRDLSAELETSLHEASIARRSLERMVITAPVGGIVWGSAVHAEQAVIQPAEDILAIVPQDQPLIVTARVPAPDVDQVGAGQDVSLRFAALDQSFTPEIFGTLTTLSADSMTDQATGQSYYEATVTPLESELVKLQGQTLVPGMPADAYIQTRTRSPLDYLVKPFANYFVRAFRER